MRDVCLGTELCQGTALVVLTPIPINAIVSTLSGWMETLHWCKGRVQERGALSQGLALSRESGTRYL